MDPIAHKGGEPLGLNCDTGGNMPKQWLFLSALFTAGCTAFFLYVLAHDELGFSRHLIVMASFWSAAILAFVWLFTTVASRAK